MSVVEYRCLGCGTGILTRERETRVGSSAPHEDRRLMLLNILCVQP
jgi:hypothetical protein